LIFWSFFIKKKGHKYSLLFGSSKRRSPKVLQLGLDFLVTFVSSRRSANLFGGTKVTKKKYFLIKPERSGDPVLRDRNEKSPHPPCELTLIVVSLIANNNTISRSTIYYETKT
jgi:hypothetical protein